MQVKTAVIPRFIRVSEAPGYLGMSRDVFNAEARAYLTEIPIGIQGKAFDRLELDAFADHYVQCYGRQPRKTIEGDTCENNVERCRDYASGAGAGRSKKGANTHKEGGSGKARAYLKERKLRDT